MSRRRGRGEGTIVPRKNTEGKLIGYQVQVRTRDGKRKTVGTRRTLTEARELLAHATAERIAGKLVASPKQTTADYLRAWLETKRISVAASTAASYDLNIRRLLPHIGHVRLDQLRAAHIEGAYAALRAGGLSLRSIQQAHTVLHAAISAAVRLGILGTAPTTLVSVPRPPRREPTTLSAEQAEQLMRSTADDPLHALWVLLLTTGLRVGEALALRWSDVDLDNGTLTVVRALRRERGGLAVVEPKTTSSRRTIHLTERAIAALRQQHTRCRRLRLQLGSAWREEGWVFPSAVGTPLDPANVHHRFERALRAAGLPDMRVHDLRHSVATLLLREGVHPRVVQELLGHATISVTLQTYSHVLPTLHREAVAKLDRLFAQQAKDA